MSITEYHYNILKNNINIKLYIDYKNYFTKLDIFKLIENKYKLLDIKEAKKQIKIDKNYIESFFFTRINNELYDKTPPYHAYKKINIEQIEQIYGKLIHKHIPYINDIIQIINNRISYIDHTYNKKITSDNKYIYIHNLKIRLDDRIRFLLNYATEMINKYSKYKEKSKIISLKLVVRLLLRYAGLGITGNQCSITTSIYNYLYENMNVKGEGYCSPLNSKLIEKDNTIICTIFKDTDKYFKSVGPFNENIMLKNKHINWLLNPPFLTSAVKKSIQSIEKTLTACLTDMIIIFVLPETKLLYKKSEILYSKYLYGYINKTEINIITENKIIPRNNTLQYFVCNGIYSHNFENIYMLFYTNNKKININNHLLHISNLWGKIITEPLQQSFFKNPTIINTSL